MAKTAVRVVLDLEVDDEALSGRARADEGAPQEFAGWLGLLSTLDALLPTAHPAPRREEQE